MRGFDVAQAGTRDGSGVAGRFGSVAPVIPRGNGQIASGLQVCEGEQHSVWLELALQVLDLPCASACMLAGTESVDELIAKVLSKWLGEQAVGIRLRLIDNDAEEIRHLEDEGWLDEADKRQPLFLEVSTCRNIKRAFIGRKMDRIFETYPGFAKLLIGVCEQVCQRGLYTLTPARLLELCSYSEWGGEMNDKAFIEAFYDGEDEAEIAEWDLVRMDDFLAVMPDWSLEHYVLSKELPASEQPNILLIEPWRTHAFDGKDSWLNEVRDLAFELIDQIDAGDHLPGSMDGFRCGCFDPAAVVYWDEQSCDFYDRIYDNYQQREMEYGIDLQCLAMIPFSPASLAEKLEDLAKAIALQARFYLLLNTLHQD